MDQTQFEAFVYQSANWLVNAIPNLIAAILILAAGYFLARWLSRVITSVMHHRHHVDQTLTPVIATMARYFVLIITFIAVLGQLGVQIASILAVLGAAGLAIGLALQGTLSNIAAGLMLLWLRPFRAGETIDSKGITGTVVEIGLFASTLRTAAGLYHFVPNSTLWNTPIINMTRNPTRRAEVEFTVNYADDPTAARAVLLDIACSEELVLRDPEPDVITTNLTDNGVVLTLRFWAETTRFLKAKSQVMERAKLALEARKAEAAKV